MSCSHVLHPAVVTLSTLFHNLSVSLCIKLRLLTADPASCLADWLSRAEECSSHCEALACKSGASAAEPRTWLS